MAVGPTRAEEISLGGWVTSFHGEKDCFFNVDIAFLLFPSSWSLLRLAATSNDIVP